LTIQIIKNLLFVFSYHLFLILLPINLFLIGLKVPWILNLSPRLFYLFLILSPILTVLLALRSTPSYNHPFVWIFPIAVSMIGYTPLIAAYFFFTSLSNFRDCLLIFTFPILIGLLSFLSSNLLNFLNASKNTN
jgi:hypothetical protein